MGVLELKGLTLSYGGEPVVRDFDLTVEDAERVSLLGPSGSGKTTVLRAIAGLMQPDRGEIVIDGKRANHLPADRRDAVMVFQRPLLFPFMNVTQNVEFGLKMRGVATAERAGRVDKMLELVGLAGMGGRRVFELSGGQQQRVALARALVLKPAILLLDEPFSNLDANLRHRMRELVLEAQEQTGVTMLFVTHDQSEAVMISRRVALLLDGKLRQTGTPEELFRRPRDEEVARFFGGRNFFAAEVKDGAMRTPFGEVRHGPEIAKPGEVMATIRPEDLVLSGDGGQGLDGVVERVRFEGSATRLWLNCGGLELIALTAASDYKKGGKVRVWAPPEKIWVLPKDRG